MIEINDFGELFADFSWVCNRESQNNINMMILSNNVERDELKNRIDELEKQLEIEKN